MLSNDEINRILDVKEGYQVVDKLQEILFDEPRKNEIFKQFLELENDLSYDWLTNYFQNEHGDRDKLKQDYTPDCLCKLVSSISGNGDILDICAGVGGLTLNKWNVNKDSLYVCEELATRSIMFLLFNLSIRNINSFVIHGDVLSQEITTIYKLTKSNEFSTIEIVENIEDMKFNNIISNPPYSITWESESLKYDKRFSEYPLAPKSKADFAFVLHGLNKLDEKGKAVFILPHGVLFRGASEGKIRQQLLEENLIEAIIGLPVNLFLNTSIPVCLLIINKNKQDTNVLFIDASQKFEKNGKQNKMLDEHLELLLATYKQQLEVKMYSHLATIEEITKNDFNLNIPRYVDTRVPEEIIPLEIIAKELAECELEIQETNKKLFSMLLELTGTTEQTQKEVEGTLKSLNYWGGD